METKLALCFVLFTATLAVGLGINCENNDEFEGKCYHFSEVYETFEDARIYCSNLDSPTVKYDLLVLDASTNKYTYIKNQLAIKGLYYAMIGVHNLGNNQNQWDWVDNTPLQMKNPLWAINYPTAGTTSQCGRLHMTYEEAYPSYIYRLRLINMSCHGHSTFICEGKEETTNEEIPETE